MITSTLTVALKWSVNLIGDLIKCAYKVAFSRWSSSTCFRRTAITSLAAWVSSLRAWISSSLGASSSLEVPKQEVPFNGGAWPENFPTFEGDELVEPVVISPAELDDFLSRKDFRSFVKAWNGMDMDWQYRAVKRAKGCSSIKAISTVVYLRPRG